MYAHSLSGRPEHEWEPLVVHLEQVAALAAGFADAFDSGAWGRLAGLWHDLGKYLPEFQARLRGSPDRVDHAGAGAVLAADSKALPLAFAIAGHHAGLANHQGRGEARGTPLTERLDDNREALRTVRALAPPHVTDAATPPPALPSFLAARPGGSTAEHEIHKRRVELWTRFLFSALVDADRLATERFYEPAKRTALAGFASVAVLRERLDTHLAGFMAATPVNRVRAEVLAECRAAAELQPGLFSLTVPTGGGKTLSAMAFALRHAERHGLRRVVVAIPYTSIIEQNARVYARVLGTGNVVEHHSALDEERALEEDSEREVRRRLAAENWDAPVVVTTNVQLFESLFANAPSRCRKLHNLARSVIVLDEAQALPPDYLDCVLDALRELAMVYGCTVVLCTATQPALTRRESFPGGLVGVHEIIGRPDELTRQLERVRVHWPAAGETTPYEELAPRLAAHERVLAIVHLRRDARELASLLPPEHRFHLSALMCAAHRSAVLKRVRARLEDGSPCRLVATQLVEAGVDIDFPAVYRALAGLDSVAQAAGRCNREGKLERGDLVVFRAETRPPPGHLRLGLESAEALLGRHGYGLELADPERLEEYFRTFYGKCRTDACGVQPERALLNFATVAQRVKLIEDGYNRPVVVPWGKSGARVRAYERAPGRGTLRALQPYLVQVPERALQRLREKGAVEEVHETVHVLARPFAHLYDAEFGLTLDEPDPHA